MASFQETSFQRQRGDIKKKHLLFRIVRNTIEINRPLFFDRSDRSWYLQEKDKGSNVNPVHNKGLNTLLFIMVDLRRKHIDVSKERRSKTRIEFHLPVVILDVDEKAQIIDFSPDGFHIELGSKATLEIGRQINLALRFPSEKNVIKIKAKIVYRDEKGIGCQFIELTPQMAEALNRCFSIFDATLPI